MHLNHTLYGNEYVNARVGETVGTLANAHQLVCSTAAPQTKLTDTFITDAALARPPQVYKQLLRLKQCPVMSAQGGLLTRETQIWVSLYAHSLHPCRSGDFIGLVQGNSYHSV